MFRTGPLLIIAPLLLKRQPFINNYIIIIIIIIIMYAESAYFGVKEAKSLHLYPFHLIL